MSDNLKFKLLNHFPLVQVTIFMHVHRMRKLVTIRAPTVSQLSLGDHSSVSLRHPTELQYEGGRFMPIVFIHILSRGKQYFCIYLLPC